MLSIPHIGFWQNVLHGPSAWIFTFVLAVVFPLLDYTLYARLKSTLQLYVWNIAAEWALAAACIWQIRTHGLRVADLGERLENPLRTLAVVTLLTAVTGVLIVVGKKQKHQASPAQVSKALDKVRRLIPESKSERRAFVAVALTAGACEELLYRGWLLNLLAAAWGSTWMGCAVSAVVFGLAHAYQGRSGIIGTSLLGCVFGILFLLTGSLLPGQVLHTAIDLNNGLALGKIVRRFESQQSGSAGT
jgi:membrane protease YdiL (CAAX protease family)